MPRIARRVVCGRSETIATLAPTIALTSVDLPTFGRPASPTNPARVILTRRSLPAARRPARGADHGGLQLEHLALVHLVVVAAQVEDAVHGRLGRGRRRARGRSTTSPSSRGPSDSAGRRRSETRARRWARRARGARDSARGSGSAPTSSTERCPSSTPAARRAAAAAGRSSTGTSARSTGTGQSSSAALALVLAVGGDDPLHELVAHDVLAAEPDERDVGDLARGSRRSRPARSAGRAAGRSG